MYARDLDIDVVQQVVVELHGSARGEEDHHFLLPLLLQEVEQDQEPLFALAHHIALEAHKGISINTNRLTRTLTLTGRNTYRH